MNAPEQRAEMTNNDAQAAMVRDYDRLTDSVESTFCKVIRQAQDTAFALGKEVAEARANRLEIALRQIAENAAVYSDTTIQEIAERALDCNV